MKINSYTRSNNLIHLTCIQWHTVNSPARRHFADVVATLNYRHYYIPPLVTVFRRTAATIKQYRDGNDIKTYRKTLPVATHKCMYTHTHTHTHTRSAHSCNSQWMLSVVTGE